MQYNMKSDIKKKKNKKKKEEGEFLIGLCTLMQIG